MNKRATICLKSAGSAFSAVEYVSVLVRFIISLFLALQLWGSSHGFRGNIDLLVSRFGPKKHSLKAFFLESFFHRKFMQKIPKMVYNRVLILATFYNENTLDNCSLLTILKLATILGSQKNLSVLKFSQQCWECWFMFSKTIDNLDQYQPQIKAISKNRKWPWTTPLP